MATSIKISQLPAKGANLEATDLLEVSEFNGTGYVTKSITGQEIIDSASGGGGVTDVTATAPIVSTGGTTPDISMAVADAGHDGYLSSTDWNTFNDKQDLLVSATNIKTINGSSVLGSGDLVVGGGVTDITVNAPLATTGGTTPDLSIYEADGTTDGFITAIDWNTFNDKQEQLVSGTNIKTINGSSVLGSGDLSIGGGLQGIHSLMFLPSTSITNQKLTGSPTLSGTLLTANTIIAAPFIPAQNITTSNLFINVTTLFAGALCRIAIYSNVNSSPSSRLYLSSDLNLSTIGVKTAVATFNFVAGTTYWLAIHGGTTGTAAVNGIQVSDLIPIKGQSISGSFCMVTAASTFTAGTPTTFPTPTFGFNNMPYIGITKA